MSWIESLSYPFMQNALIAVFFAGIAFPLMGVFILSLNLVPLRFAMMHVALLGGRWVSSFMWILCSWGSCFAPFPPSCWDHSPRR